MMLTAGRIPVFGKVVHEFGKIVREMESRIRIHEHRKAGDELLKEAKGLAGK